jgi:hypothetical protein
VESVLVSKETANLTSEESREPRAPAATPVARGLREAVEYATKNWFPANPDCLSYVRKQAQAGAYDSNRTALFQDLKKDLAIFARTLRALGEVVSAEDRSKHPVKILKHLEPAELRKLLVFPEEGLSTHRFELTDDIQAQRLRHAVISSGTAELLAEHSDFDPDVVFSCALIRQIGFIVSAYSYPRTFAKGLGSLNSSKNNLEAALFRYLGFSPTMLGIQSAISWSTCPSLLIGVGYDTVAGGEHAALAADLDEELRYTAESIASFCELGEVFARLNDPKHYTVSGKEHERVTTQLTQVLGPRALSVLQERIGVLGANYTTIAPKVFSLDVSQRSAPKGGLSAHALKLMDRNTNLQKLSPEHRARFKKMYEQIEDARVSLEATGVLVNEVVQALGFVSGCVYMADPDNVALVPRLKIGPVSLAKFKALQWSKTSPISHPVLEAVSCSVPIKQENVFMYGENVSHVTGVFGTREKVGVLYLEMSAPLTEADNHQPILRFKAVRQALNDCLNLHEPGAVD